MKRKSTIILIFLLIISIQSAFATTDYLVVNHITKQLYWAETDHPPGLIGWKGVGDVYEIQEQQYLDLGYTHTGNPFMIEEVIIIVIILSLLTYWVVRKRKNALQQRP